MRIPHYITTISVSPSVDSIHSPQKANCLSWSKNTRKEDPVWAMKTFGICISMHVPYISNAFTRKSKKVVKYQHDSSNTTYRLKFAETFQSVVIF